MAVQPPTVAARSLGKTRPRLTALQPMRRAIWRKNVVAAGLTEKCTIQLSYAIGVARPLSIYADTFGTGQVSEEQIEKAVSDCMDLTPRGIRTHLGLNKPIYQRTAAYGHFGRAPDADGGFSWERTDLIDALKAAV